jgi:2-haloalkanoic acid dehalogenase type II
MDPGSRASRLAGTTIFNGAARMPVRAFVFDAYGTLFDVHAAVARHREAAGPDADRFSEIWRTKQLEYAWMLSAAGHYVDFWTLTERALDHAFARVPSVDRKLRTTLLDAYFKLDAFPDARAALKALKASGLKTAILSNGNPRMLQGAVDAAGLKDDLDAVLSVDSIRIYNRSLKSMRWSPTRSASRQPMSRSFHRTAGTSWAQLPSASAAYGSTARICRTNIRNSHRSRSCVT